MRRSIIVVIIAFVALLGSYAAIRAQGPPGGRRRRRSSCQRSNGSRGVTRGFRGCRQTIPNDGPAPRRELTGQWDSARGGIGARGAARHAGAAHRVGRGEGQDAQVGRRHPDGGRARHQRSALDAGRSRRLPAPAPLRDAPRCSSCHTQVLDRGGVHVGAALSDDLDRRPAAACRSRSAVVRLLDRALGGRLRTSSSIRTAPTSEPGSTTAATRTAIS